MRAVLAAVAVSLVLALAAAQTTAVWESGLDTLITNVPFSKSLAELPEVKAPSKTAAPGRSGHCTVWYKGSLYIFGGKRGSAVANDLWRYDAASSQWEFLLGAKEPNHPGTQALPSSRAGHSCSVDNDRFLVFGGHKGNSENLADVWAYSFAHNNWLQLSSGQRIPSYTSGMLSHPGARTNHAAVFDAKSKTLVILGGRNSQGLLNDVWQYEVEKGLWHFLAGAQKPNAVGEYPKYGKTKSPALGAAGLAEPKKDVVPGARENPMCAAAEGRIVCYGGKGYAADTLVGTLSDVWSFNLEKKKWRFLHGHDTHRVDVSAIFPVPKPKRGRQNHPVASVGGTSTAKKLQQYFRFRAEDAVTSHEEMHAEGALCPGGRFGGVFGIDTTENIAYVLGGLNNDEHVMNDMWSFDLVKRKWSFIRGTTKSASYGTKGKETGAFPPARAFSSGVVTDSAARKGSKRFLLFGGQGEVADTVFADVWSVELVKPVRKPRPATKPGKPKAKKSKHSKPSSKPKAPPAGDAANDSEKDATVNNPFDKDVSKPEAGANKPASPDVKPFIPAEPPVVTGEVPIDPDCCGKGKTPVLVGPYNIPNKETRAVRVIGDKSPEIHLDIPAQTSWFRPHLDEAKKYVPKSHRVITDVKKKHKKLRYSPLVEN